MAMRAKNFTFSLPTDLLEKFRDYVRQHDIPSLNAAVREALEEYLKKIEKEKLRREMAEASKDPLFMKDVRDCMQSFEVSDSETAGRIPEW